MYLHLCYLYTYVIVGVRKWNRMTKNQKVIYEAQSRITKNTQVEVNTSQV